VRSLVDSFFVDCCGLRGWWWMAVVNRVFETGCIVGMKENLYVAFDLGWCLALSISPSLCVCVCVCV